MHVLVSRASAMARRWRAGWVSGNDTTKNTGRSGRQNTATRSSTRREEQVTVQGPGKETAARRNATQGA